MSSNQSGCSLSVSVEKPTRVLLVEDDAEVGEALKETLSVKGYRVDWESNGTKGLSAALSGAHDLILLDKLLPEVDGLDLLQKLRQRKNTPVIMLTACGSEQDRIEGFQEGADDYLPKPFNVIELELRIEALLRRSQRQCSHRPHSLSDGGLVLDTSLRQASYHQSEVALTPIEFQLLEILMVNRGEVLSKPYLSQTVLNKPLGRYDRSVDMHISNLRAKLGKAIPNTALIKTVHGTGYRYLPLMASKALA